MSNKTPAAGIMVTVIQFVPAAADDGKSYTTATVKLVGNANGTVSQATPNGAIRVDRGAVVDLVFAMAPASPETYYPVGISFLGHNGGVGMDDFPTRTIDVDAFNGMTLTVRDANLDSNVFDFKLVVQRQSDGALGIIDPHINNA